MNCPRCGTGNNAYETRCTRCGARFAGGTRHPYLPFGEETAAPGGVWSGPGSGPRPFLVNPEARFSAVVTNAVVVPPPPTLSSEMTGGLTSSASTARQLHHPPELEQAPAPRPAIREKERPKLTLAPPSAQPSLFPPGELSGPPAELRVETRGAAQHAVSPPRRKPARKRAKSDVLPFAQGTLEFLTPMAPPARQLRTKVDASVRCEQPIAPPMRRVAAASVDAAYSGLGAALLIGAVMGCLRYFEVPLPANPVVSVLGAVAVWCAVAVAYQAVFAFMDVDSPGHGKLDLQVMSFDGSLPTPTQRWKRVLGACVSLAAGGAGFLWAVFDEERLSWHDHISETFSTPKSGLDSSFHRQ